MPRPLSLEFRSGFARRLREAMQRAGYWKADHPDAEKLAGDFGCNWSNVYRWLAGQVPSFEDCQRLAAVLKVKPGWLAFGDEVMRPLVGWCVALFSGLSLLAASAHAGVPDSSPPDHTPLAVERSVDTILLIGRWRRWVARWLGMWPYSGTAFAWA